MRHMLIASIVVVALILLAVRPAIGEVGPLFSLAWWTVDGGGYVSRGTVSTGSGDTLTNTVAYTLTSTIAQPDAGWMSGGAYSLGGGFWGTSVGPHFKIYLPLARSN